MNKNSDSIIEIKEKRNKLNIEAIQVFTDTSKQFQDLMEEALSNTLKNKLFSSPVSYLHAV